MANYCHENYSVLDYIIKDIKSPFPYKYYDEDFDVSAQQLFVYFQLFLQIHGLKAIYEGPRPSFWACGEIVEIQTKNKVGTWAFDGINEDQLHKYQDLPIKQQATEFAKIEWPPF